MASRLTTGAVLSELLREIEAEQTGGGANRPCLPVSGTLAITVAVCSRRLPLTAVIIDLMFENKAFPMPRNGKMNAK
jgi:hypothetical protein